MKTNGDHNDSIRKISLTTAAAALIGSLLTLSGGDPGSVAESLEAFATLTTETAPTLPLRGDWPW